MNTNIINNTKTMKHILIAALFAFASIPSMFADSPPPALEVLTDLDAAKEQSKETGKPVFIEFMSSACPYCQAFKKNVLSDPAFIAYANEQLIVVIHDIKELPKLPKEESKTRKDLMEKLKVDGFPTILLIDKSGKILLRSEGYSGTPAEKIIASLKAAQKPKPAE